MGDDRNAVGVPATEGSEWCALLAATNIYPRGTAAKRCQPTAPMCKIKNLTSQVRYREMTGTLKLLSQRSQSTKRNNATAPSEIAPCQQTGELDGIN